LPTRVDYRGAVDRDALARAALRRQAEDSLAFERDREEMLTVELQDLLADAAREEIDAAVFSAMAPEDAVRVRVALGTVESVDWDYVDEAEDDEPEVDDAVGVDEEEIARLQGEIESSRRSQVALERYLELLGAMAEQGTRDDDSPPESPERELGGLSGV
jgi:hypothetical protein